MPQNLAGSLKIPEFNIGLSYRLDEKLLSYREQINGMINNRRLEKRYGIDFLIKDGSGDSPDFGRINSISYFQDADSVRNYLFKSGASFYRVDNDSTSFVTLGSGFNADSKHRGLTLNNRHMVAMGDDGLYQYVGTTFTQAGNQLPTQASIVDAAGAGALTSGDYRAQYTLYSSITGYESLPSSPSDSATITTGSLKIFNLQSSADNKLIDKLRIYLKKSTLTEYIFYAEVPLGTLEYFITADSLSSQNPPDDTQLLPVGGAKYLTEYNGRLVVAGNSQFPNDIIFSNEDDPESFDDGATAIRLAISGNGPVTGIATGLYSNTVLDPFLVCFKENATWIYSQIGNQAKLVRLNESIGCVSHDSIVVRNGVVYFLSRYGWFGVKNGLLISKDSKPYSLGGGAIDDIFEDSGMDQYVNISKLKNAFSFHFHVQDVYVTFIPLNGDNNFHQAYVYNFNADSFLKWSFPISIISAVVGQDSSGLETILLGQQNKNYVPDVTAPGERPSALFKMSKKVGYSDTYYSEDTVSPVKQSDAISFETQIRWQDGGDYDASYNFRELLFRLKRYQPDLLIKAWVNFTYSFISSQVMELPEPDATFILDESYLDIDSLGEGADAVTARCDLNVTGENLLLGIYQNDINENIILTSGQLNFSRNGNRNK